MFKTSHFGPKDNYQNLLGVYYIPREGRLPIDRLAQLACHFNPKVRNFMERILVDEVYAEVRWSSEAYNLLNNMS